MAESRSKQAKLEQAAHWVQGVTVVAKIMYCHSVLYPLRSLQVVIDNNLTHKQKQKRKSDRLGSGVWLLVPEFFVKSW